MATSEAQICNKALARLGIKSFIEDLSDDGTEEAEACNVFYEDTRDACLAAFPWPFATLRKALAEVDYTTEPARDGWDKIFKLPDGCLAPRYIREAGDTLRAFREDDKIPFVIEKASVDDSQVLLCDLETPVLFYTARVEDVTKFPPLFVDAFSWLLAQELAMPLTVKPDRLTLAQKMYTMKINEARAMSFNGQQEDPQPETESIAARR